MKVSELEGDDLALWTGRAAGYEYTTDPARLYEVYSDGKPVLTRGPYGNLGLHSQDLANGYADWRPHEDWAQGGPLIDKYRMYVDGGNPHDQGWSAATGPSNMAERAHGETPLQAICRAVVRAEFGDEVPEQP